MELIEVKSLIWAQKGKLYIIYEKVHEQYKTGALKRKRQVKQNGNILR
jgi:hypothetical protein